MLSRLNLARHLVYALQSFSFLDEFSCRVSPVHAWDPRVRVSLAFGFALLVAGVPRDDLVLLVLLGAVPGFLIAASGYPLRILGGQILMLSPLVVGVAFGELVVSLVSSGVSGIWWAVLSASSLVFRFAIVSACLIVLMATLSLPELSRALLWFRVPRVFVSVILLVYRFLFVLIDDISRTIEVLALRLPAESSLSWRLWADVLSGLLLRTVARAERVQEAVLLRAGGRDGFCDFS